MLIKACDAECKICGINGTHRGMFAFETFDPWNAILTVCELGEVKRIAKEKNVSEREVYSYNFLPL